MVCMGRLESPYSGSAASETEPINSCNSPLTSPSVEATDATISSATSGHHRDNLHDSLHYTSSVEFSLKLGYTQSQVQTALVNLGPGADQNTLLEELIKLASISDSKSGNSTCDDHDDDNDAEDINAVNKNFISSSAVFNDQRAFRDAISCKLDHINGTDNGSSSSTSSPSPIIPFSLSSQFCESCYVSALRPIVIDGTNVAINHGKRDVFSCRGISICVNLFRKRGHRDISVLVPMWRKEYSRPDAPIIDQDILLQLERENIVVFTPSRSINGQRINCHDDRFIVKLAAETGGVIVSNDKFQDLLTEYTTINPNVEYQKVIRERHLMYVFVNDLMMLPDDPLGREGISLDKLLLREKGPCPHSARTYSSSSTSSSNRPPTCPYNKKCTYGNKCKYDHPERSNQQIRSVADRILEQSRAQLLDSKTRSMDAEITGRMKACQTASLPPSLHSTLGDCGRAKALTRTKSIVHSTLYHGKLPSSLLVQSTIDQMRTKPRKYYLSDPEAFVTSSYQNTHLPVNSIFTSIARGHSFRHISQSGNQSSLFASASTDHVNLDKSLSDPVNVGSRDSVITYNSSPLSEERSVASPLNEDEYSSVNLPSSSHPAHLLGRSPLHYHQLKTSHSLNTCHTGGRQHRKLVRQLTLNPFDQTTVTHSMPSEAGLLSAISPPRTTSLFKHDILTWEREKNPAAERNVKAPISRGSINYHGQKSLGRMLSEPSSRPSFSSQSSSTVSSENSNRPASTEAKNTEPTRLIQARKVLDSFSRDGSLNHIFSDLILLSISDNGSLDAELFIQNKHCNAQGMLHEAFISGLICIVSSLSFHLPLGVDLHRPFQRKSTAHLNCDVNSCSCGRTLKLSINYLSLAKIGDVILLHCDILKIENRATFNQIEIYNGSNKNEHVASSTHVIAHN